MTNKEKYLAQLDGNFFRAQEHNYHFDRYDEKNEKIWISWTYNGGGTAWHRAERVFGLIKDNTWKLIITKKPNESYLIY